MIMSPVLKPTWARVFLPLLTLAFPLGVLLMILLRLPAQEVELASTDTRLLHGFSTFWCGWQEVTSTHPFYAYKVPQTPKVVRNEVNVNNLAFRFTLSKGHYHYLRYHVLEGSTIEAVGCASVYPAQLDIVYGEERFSSCWSENRYRIPVGSHHSRHTVSRIATDDDDVDNDNDDDDSSSSSSSEEEEEEEEEDDARDLNLIRGGGRGRRGQRSALAGGASLTSKDPCPGSSFSSRIEVSSERSDQDYPTCPSRFRASVNATRSGVYYVVTRGDSPAINRVLLHVRLNRTGFELPENMILCRSQNACEIPLSFGSGERVVVFVSAEPDAGSVLFPIRSKCKPRLVFYVSVFLVFPSLFALALTLAIRQARKRAESAALLSPEVPDDRHLYPESLSVGGTERVLGGSRAPLLEAMVAEDGVVKTQVRRFEPSPLGAPSPLAAPPSPPPPPYPSSAVCRDLPPSYATVVSSPSSFGPVAAR